MSRKTRLFLLLGFALAGFACLAGLGVHGALRRVPSFYEAALGRDAVEAARSSDEFLQGAAGVASDVRKPGAWDAAFTVDQINGWLAVDVPRNLPDLLPPELSEPRVFIHPGAITLACRYHGEAIDTVLSITCDVYLHAPHVLAIRIKGAQAGLLPLPLAKVLDAITHAAQALELPLEWRRAGGDPVALVSIVSPQARGAERIELDSLDLREGEIVVAGHTGSARPIAVAARPRAPGEVLPSFDGDVPAQAPADETPAPGVGIIRLPTGRFPAAEAPNAGDPTGLLKDDSLVNQAPAPLPPPDRAPAPAIEPAGGDAPAGASSAVTVQSPEEPAAASLDSPKETLQR